MEDFRQPSVARAAIMRSSKACQRCRSLKARCLPSSQPETCQRCFGAGKECVWSEEPRRARKLRAPSRIAQVEQKIDGLVAKLVNPIESGSESNTAPEETPVQYLRTPAQESRQEIWTRQKTVAPGSWMPVPSFELDAPQPQQATEQALDETEADQQYIEKIRNMHEFGNREDVSQAPGSLFQPSKRPEAPIEHEIVEQILSTGESDTLLNEFRQMSGSFPFVVVPPGISGHELHASRPMLFLAIITVASWKNHQRQMSLDNVYRTELANRTIIRPRKMLGLVQSVLVYLSWYHFVFSHKTQQIFFLHHLVIGLALDIGLHQEYRPLNFPTGPKPPPPSPQEQRERHRAFLGCYYLASMVAAGLQKPNLLKHTPYMTEWAQDLKRDREYESDEIIGHLISLRQIDDQVQDTLFAGGAVELPLSDARTLMHVRFMEAQLNTWKGESHGAGSERLFTLSSSFTNMLLHSVALRRPSSEQLPTTDSTQLNSLLSALEAGKRFLDALLSFPAHEYHLISFSEWMRLPTVLMTVARICIPTDAHVAAGWDVTAAQDRVRLDLCLESLCYRMQSLSTYDKQTQPHPDFWYAMRIINDLTKTWYIRKIGPSLPFHAPPQPTPSGTSAKATTEVSGPSSAAQSTLGAHQAGERNAMLASINYMGDISMEPGIQTEDDNEPFAFLKNTDLDMEQFLDVGIWGDESYSGMGLGGELPF